MAKHFDRPDAHPLRTARMEQKFLETIEPLFESNDYEIPIEYRCFMHPKVIDVYRDLVDRREHPSSIILNQEIIDSIIENMEPSMADDLMNDVNRSQSDWMGKAIRLCWGMLGKRLLHESDSLHEIIDHFDINDIPMSMLQLPFDCFAITLSRTEPKFMLYIEPTGWHQVDTIYIYRSKALPGTRSIKTATQTWNLNGFESNNEEAICFEITCLPNENSEHECDDCREIVCIDLDPDKSIETGVYEALKRSNDAIDLSEEMGYDIPEGLVRFNDLDKKFKSLGKIINHVCKFILYLSCREMRDFIQDKDYTRARNQFKRASGKKLPKLGKHVSRAIDVIYVKPNRNEQSLVGAMKGGKGEMPPHVRRGYLRMQRYGKGLSEQKIVAISPTIVRKDLLADGESIEGKDYVVK